MMLVTNVYARQLRVGDRIVEATEVRSERFDLSTRCFTVERSAPDPYLVARQAARDEVWRRLDWLNRKVWLDEDHREALIFHEKGGA